MRQTPKVIPHCLLFLLFLSGCSSVSLPSLPSRPSWPWSTPAVQPNPTAEALFNEGVNYLKNKRYVLAIDRFQKVKAEFPFSPQLVPAELKLAEAYYLNKQYPEADAAFKEFHELHPNNENTPFVVYHLGLVNFDQFTSTDRDQKLTALARGYFENVVKNYPNSPFAAPAKEKLAKCLEYLSEYEFNVATFYFNGKKYPAAISRLEDILRHYRETAVAPKALYYLGESYRLEKNNVNAALAYEALAQHYPDNPLTKTAQAQLSQLEKEKTDPLALLLKRDGRPAFAPPPPPEVRQQAIGNRQEKAPNLVVKKEVVHEEPGEQKGILRRVGGALNPTGWFSSDDKKKNGNGPIETAKKEESSGSFWSSLNPFAAKAKVEAKRDPRLLPNVDEALKQSGVDGKAQNQAPKANLPKVEEPAPPPADTAELLGKVDADLKRQGKDATELPAPPEPSKVFTAVKTQGKSSAAPGAAGSVAPAASGLITSIDEALKRKGIDPSKIEATSKTGEGETARRPGGEEASRPSSKEKIELAPKLPQEKGPLFLEGREYQAQEKPGEGQEARKPGGEEASQPSKEGETAGKPESLEASQPSSLPASVLKAPQPVKEKAEETKVTAEKKKSAGDEEEPKGGLEQLKEDLGKIRDALNPLSW